MPKEKFRSSQRAGDAWAQWSKLWVRDPSRSWYKAGLPGIGETAEEIAAWLRDQVAAFGATRVVTTGPSMGGYAAILFGCMIGAEQVIAIAPQTVLDPGLRYMMPLAELPLQERDLEPVMRAAPHTRIELVFGWGSPMDMFHAQRVAAVPSVRLLSAEGGHDLSRELNERARLWPLIEQLVEGTPPDWCETDPEFDQALLPTLREVIAAAADEDWQSGAEAGERLAAGCPDWPTARPVRDEMRARQRQSAPGG